MTTVFAILALGALLTPVFGRGFARRSGMEAGWAGSPWWAPLGILCLTAGLGLAALQRWLADGHCTGWTSDAGPGGCCGVGAAPVE
jgi:hypothetical protein